MSENRVESLVLKTFAEFARINFPCREKMKITIHLYMRIIFISDPGGRKKPVISDNFGIESRVESILKAALEYYLSQTSNASDKNAGFQLNFPLRARTFCLKP